MSAEEQARAWQRHLGNLSEAEQVEVDRQGGLAKPGYRELPPGWVWEERGPVFPDRAVEARLGFVVAANAYSRHPHPFGGGLATVAHADAIWVMGATRANNNEWLAAIAPCVRRRLGFLVHDVSYQREGWVPAGDCGFVRLSELSITIEREPAVLVNGLYIDEHVRYVSDPARYSHWRHAHWARYIDSRYPRIHDGFKPVL